MKKALSFAVALGLVAGMASSAVASDILEIHGDARWRGATFTDTDFDENTPDGLDFMDQRYRIVADINVNEDLKIGTRIVLLNQDVASTPDPSYMATGNDVNHAVDRAYMQAKMLGGTWLIGRQDASWGNKFLGWGASVDRVKGTYKSGDLTFGGYLQKNTEAGDNNDNDTYGAFIIGKVGDTKWGALPNYVVDHRLADNNTGHLLDVFFNTKAGAVNIMGEFVYKGGDLFENAQGDAVMGGFVGAQATIDALSVKGILAYYMNNEGVSGGSRDCDNDFAPSVLIGTCNETALIDFGGTTLDGNPFNAVTRPEGTGVAADSDDSTMLIGAGVDFKVNDKLTVGTYLGYLDASDKADTQLLEFDLTAAYVLAKGITYKVSFAYGDVSAPVATDAIMVLGNNISVAW